MGMVETGGMNRRSGGDGLPSLMRQAGKDLTMEKTSKRTRYYAEGTFRIRMKEEGGGFVLVPADSRFVHVQGDDAAPEAEEGRDKILFSLDRYAHFFDGEGDEMAPELLGSGTIDGKICVELQEYDYKFRKTTRHWKGYKAVAFLVNDFTPFSTGWSSYVGGVDD